MHLKPFEYLAPRGLDEALAMLGAKPPPLPLAGGTDLIVLMKEGKLRPRALMSLRQVAELRLSNGDAETCRLGAGLTISALGGLELARSNPCIADAVRQMATPQIRNRATLGGNLCTSAACADFPPVLLVSEADVELQSAAGPRRMKLADFHTGLRQVDRRADELLVAVTCRRSNPGSAYVKFGVRRAANIAVAGVACALQLAGDEVKELRIATTAACPVCGLVEEAAQTALGQPATEETWRIVAQAVRQQMAPISDLRGSAEYRLHLIEVGTLRALRLAHQRLLEVSHA
jgi:CO/xanthine dehydrogenase FAD-binding subunit